MKSVRSQDMHNTVAFDRIIRTEIQHKEYNCWLVAAIIEQDRVVIMGRYPTEKDAIIADTLMWLSEESTYMYPVHVHKVNDPDGES